MVRGGKSRAATHAGNVVGNLAQTSTGSVMLRVRTSHAAVDLQSCMHSGYMYSVYSGRNDNLSLTLSLASDNLATIYDVMKINLEADSEPLYLVYEYTKSYVCTT